LFKKSEKYYNLALETCSNENQKKKIYANLSNVHFKNNDKTKSLDLIKLSINLSKESNDLTLLSKNYSILALFYGESGKLEKSLKYYNKSLEIAKSLSNGFEGRVYSYIGSIMKDMGRLHEAYEYFEKSKEIIEKTNQELYKSNIYNEISILLGLNFNQIDQAINLTLESLKISIKNKQIESIINCYSNLGIFYSISMNYEESFKNYNLALKYCDDYEINSSKVLSNLGNLMIKNKKYNEGIKYIQ
jgi:tetratricopeptide (TPR) repeat protein